jgi:hypothetical protein
MRNGLRKQIGIAVTAAALLLSAQVARSQDDGPPPPPPGQHVGVRMGPLAGLPGEEIGFMGFEAGLAGKTVTGAPFTATVSTQITRTLADGNKIDQTITGTIARDSQGRTRRDMTLPGAALAPIASTSPHAVFINDPVAGRSYILHPDWKEADALPFRVWRRLGRRVLKGMGGNSADQNPQNETSVNLGTQTINGVTAQGTRTTRTIPAGQIGNERPIVIVTERWYSPDLQTYVLTKRLDPLMGDTVFQLTNIQREEPDPALFQVPSNYAVKQRPAPTMRFRQQGGTEAPQHP